MRFRRNIWFFVKLVIGVALIATVCLYDGNGRKAIAQFASLQWGYLLLLGTLTLFLVWLSCLKWNLFLVAFGAKVSVARLMGLYFIGRYFDSFFPSTIGSDFVRTVLMGRQIGNKSQALASVLLERFTGVISLLGLALVCGLATATVLVEPVFIAAMSLVFVFCLGLLLTLIYGRATLILISERLNHLPGVTNLASKILRIHDQITYFHDRRRLLTKAVGYSLLFHIVTGFKVYTACLCVGANISPLPIIVITPVLLLVMVIPVSIGNLGWWEWACTVLLVGVGLDAPQGLAAALLLRAFTFATALAGGVLLLRERSTLASSEITQKQTVAPRIDDLELRTSRVTTNEP